MTARMQHRHATNCSLSELEVLRSKMTPGEYALDEDTGAIHAAGSGELDSKADGHGLAAEHNAMPALLALAKAVLELERVEREFAEAAFVLASNEEEIKADVGDLSERCCELRIEKAKCRSAYDAARAAVSP